MAASIASWAGRIPLHPRSRPRRCRGLLRSPWCQVPPARRRSESAGAVRRSRSRPKQRRPQPLAGHPLPVFLPYLTFALRPSDGSAGFPAIEACQLQYGYLLRLLGHPESMSGAQTHHPGDLITADQHGDVAPHDSRHLRVDEKVTELLSSTHPEGLKAVARLLASQRQVGAELVGVERRSWSAQARFDLGESASRTESGGHQRVQRRDAGGARDRQLSIQGSLPRPLNEQPPVAALDFQTAP